MRGRVHLWNMPLTRCRSAICATAGRDCARRLGPPSPSEGGLNPNAAATAARCGASTGANFGAKGGEKGLRLAGARTRTARTLAPQVYRFGTGVRGSVVALTTVEVFPMTLRYVLGGVTTVVIGCGLSIGVAFAQQRDGGLLPLDQSGEVTVTGCLMRGDQLRAGDSDKFALARPRAGSVASVPERTCSADADATAVHLDNPEKGDITEAMLGRWIEIHGRLEKETSSHDNLRELDVLSARLIPVEVPRVAAAPAPEPAAPAPAPEPEPAPIPVATSGQAAPELPTTASYGPLAGLLGLFACAGGIVLRSLRSRQRG